MTIKKIAILLVLLVTVLIFLLHLSFGLVMRYASCGVATDVPASLIGDYTGSIISGGLKRDYCIHVPPSYDKNRSMPLVIALHGGGTTGKMTEILTLGGFNTLADRDGFVVVYPDGIGRHWDDGREGARYYTHKEKIDDVGFISSLIDHLVNELNIDNKSVYVTGISNGATMSNRLACELSEKISAIAPVAGAMPKGLNCSPSKPISVLAINSVEDPLVPWGGGDIRLGFLKVGKVLSVNETVSYWAIHDNCSSSPNVTWEPDKDPQDGTRVRKEVYENCGNGTEVVLYAIEGGGHTWPGGIQYLPKIVIGRTSRDIDANEVIWNFFKEHR
jgi:polyhydroxybutyrate depolymerase